MKEKNKFLQAASIIMILCAVLAILITAINTNAALSSISGLSPEEQTAVEAQLSEGDITMDQVMTAVSAIAYVGLGLTIIFNIIKVIVGFLGLKKADTSSKFFIVWGIILLVFGVLSLSSGILNPLGICNLLGGVAAPILFIIGGNQNKKEAGAKNSAV